MAIDHVSLGNIALWYQGRCGIYNPFIFSVGKVSIPNFCIMLIPMIGSPILDDTTKGFFMLPFLLLISNVIAPSIPNGLPFTTFDLCSEGVVPAWGILIMLDL